jgi:HK97 gp10 family phage protein
MADKVTVQLEGFADFEEQIKALAEGYRSDLVARNTLVKACKDAMIPVLNASYSLANYDEKNVDNIHMRDTLRIDARIPSEKDKMSEYVNDTDSAIGVMSVKKSAVSLANEFGTAKMAAKPFLIPALESNIKNVTDALKYELSFLIPEYARKLRKRGIK